MLKLNVTEATPVVLLPVNVVKVRGTATTTPTAWENSDVGETTATKMLTVGSTKLMTAALTRCQEQMVAKVETTAALPATNAVRAKVTATLIPTAWGSSVVGLTTAEELLDLMPLTIVASTQILWKAVTEETLAAQLPTLARRVSETATLTRNVLRSSNAVPTTATRATQCLMSLMTAAIAPSQEYVMETILVVLRSTNAVRGKETVTLILIVRATLFVAPTIVTKIMMDLMPLMIAARHQFLQVLLSANVVTQG